MMSKSEKLLKSSLNVFTTQDLMTLWEIEDKVKLWNVIRYYLRTEKLFKVHKGVYSLGEYTDFDLAQKLVKPSYISFYTALVAHGIVFQFYLEVHAMSLVSKTIKIKEKDFVYHKLKDEVFFNSFGVEARQGYSMAGPERAICDSLYLAPSLGFDSLKMIDFRELKAMSKIYSNNRLEKDVEKLIKMEGK